MINLADELKKQHEIIIEYNYSDELPAWALTMINDHKGNMFEFTEWVGKYFIRMHGGWMRNYSNQHNLNNLITTEKLYEEYITIIKIFNETLEE